MHNTISTVGTHISPPPTTTWAHQSWSRTARPLRTIRVLVSCWSFVFQEVQPEWQTAASNVLVAVGMKYCNEVMAELHEKFQPGVLPHFFVVQTMANLSVANGQCFLFASHCKMCFVLRNMEDKKECSQKCPVVAVCHGFGVWIVFCSVWNGSLLERCVGPNAADAGHGKARQHEMGFLCRWVKASPQNVSEHWHCCASSAVWSS